MHQICHSSRNTLPTKYIEKNATLLFHSTHPRDNDKETRWEVVVEKILQGMSLELHFKTCQRKISDSIPNVNAVLLIKVGSNDRIIQDGVVGLFVVEQLLGDEGHLGVVESEAAYPELADLDVQRIQVEPHWAPEGHVSFLRIEDPCSVD